MYHAEQMQEGSKFGSQEAATVPSATGRATLATGCADLSWLPGADPEPVAATLLDGFEEPSSWISTVAGIKTPACDIGMTGGGLVQACVPLPAVLDAASPANGRLSAYLAGEPGGKLMLSGCGQSVTSGGDPPLLSAALMASLNARTVTTHMQHPRYKCYRAHSGSDLGSGGDSASDESDPSEPMPRCAHPNPDADRPTTRLEAKRKAASACGVALEVPMQATVEAEREHSAAQGGGCGSGEKKKVGRPITYKGDVNSPHLTEEERRRIKRRVANRDSARRVRQKRQELMDEMQTQIQQLQAQNHRLLRHVAEVESTKSVLLAQLSGIKDKWTMAVAENLQLQGEVTSLRNALETQHVHVQYSNGFSLAQHLVSPGLGLRGPALSIHALSDHVSTPDTPTRHGSGRLDGYPFASTSHAGSPPSTRAGSLGAEHGAMGRIEEGLAEGNAVLELEQQMILAADIPGMADTPQPCPLSRAASGLLPSLWG